MNIWILMQEVQTLGGVQRVVTQIANRLAVDGRYSIYILAPISQTNKQLYDISDSIRCINARELQEKQSFCRTLLRKMNSHFAILDKIGLTNLCGKIYFPEKTVKNYCDVISAEGADCIIGAGTYYSILAAKISRELHVRCIAWMHSTYEAYFEVPVHDGYGLRKLFAKYTPYIENTLVLTKKDKEAFEHNFPLLKKSVIVLYNPLTINVHRRSVLDKCTVLYVGRLNIETKGIDRLLPIMKLINKKFPDVVLEVVGDGVDKDKFTDMIRKNRMEKNIKAAGVSNNVETYYERASVLLVTSRYEGFGLVITEAMAHGIPVVSFHANGPDEIITDDDNGYLIDQGNIEKFADKVNELLSDEKLFNRISRNAELRAQDFAMDKILVQFRKILEG